MVPPRQLRETAGGLGIHFDPPSRGQLHALAPTARVVPLGDVFTAYAAVAESGTNPPEHMCDGLLDVVVNALSETDRPRRIGVTGRIDSRCVTLACLEYANSIGRIPSISELCLAAHVSERRLRKAFVDEFDRPPSRFFRAWALSAAHRRLVAGRTGRDTVTRVATDLGFAQLGRFSGHYKAIYGEPPAATLRSREAPA